MGIGTQEERAPPPPPKKKKKKCQVKYSMLNIPCQYENEILKAACTMPMVQFSKKKTWAHIFCTVEQHLPKLPPILPLYWIFEVWKCRMHHNMKLLYLCTDKSTYWRIHEGSFKRLHIYPLRIVADFFFLYRHGGWFMPFRYFATFWRNVNIWEK